MQKTCNKIVYDSDAPPPALPKPTRKRGKTHKEVIPEQPTSPLLLLEAPSRSMDNPGAITRRYK
jgi:hypothetical protein